MIRSSTPTAPTQPASSAGSALSIGCRPVLGARHARSAEWGAGIREGFSDLRFADANRVPFPFAPIMRERFNLTTVVTVVRWAAFARPRWRLEPRRERLVRAQRRWIRSIQGVDSEGLGPCERSRPRPRARPSDRRRQHPDAARRVRPRRSLVSHERHRGGDGRRPAGPLQHAPPAHRVLLRRVSRLVGRCGRRALAANDTWTTASRSRISARRRCESSSGAPTRLPRCS